MTIKQPKLKIKLKHGRIYGVPISLYEENLQIECKAVTVAVGELHCLACGKEFSEEYWKQMHPYHHPICKDCRDKHWQDIGDNM